jgi:hypothetical protein
LERAERERLSTRKLEQKVQEPRPLHPPKDEDECPDLDVIMGEVRDRLRACYGEVVTAIVTPGINYRVERRIVMRACGVR